MRKIQSTNTQNQLRLTDICPLGHALLKIGTRWKPLILYKLLNRTYRFGELRSEIAFITDRMLILSLKELESDGLITKKDFGVYPKKVEYNVTPSGRELDTVLMQLYEWGAADLGKLSPAAR